MSEEKTWDILVFGPWSRYSSFLGLGIFWISWI